MTAEDLIEALTPTRATEVTLPIPEFDGVLASLRELCPSRSDEFKPGRCRVDLFTPYGILAVHRAKK